jgi:hypothetical protein
MVSINMFRLFFILVVLPNFATAAPFNLRGSSPLIYAAEPLTKSDFGGFGALVIGSVSDDLNITFEVGFTLSTDLKYIRLDVNNGKFGDSFSGSAFITNVAYSTLLVAGGNTDDSYLIAQVSAPTLLANDTIFTLESDKFYISDVNKPLNIRYRLYDSAAAAINDGRIIIDINSDVARVENGLGVSFSESFIQRTGFSDNFMRFIPSFRSPNIFSLGDANKTLSSLAKFQGARLILDDVRLASTSELITDFRVLLPNISTDNDISIISGDFSSIKAFLNVDDDCAGARYELAEYTTEREVNVSLDTLADYPVFCLTADGNNKMIKRSAYELDLGIGATPSLFGEITYNAATIDLPYVTTYSGYRQRILLVNHAGYAVNYITEFTAEASVAGNFSTGISAEGIIPPNTTLKFNAQDLVTINSGGATRVSARLFFDAKATDISAAVQILSLDSNLPPITNVLQVIEY